jgi:phosphoglycolate phosphatase-like HAD superfamily hydrolase
MPLTHLILFDIDGTLISAKEELAESTSGHAKDLTLFDEVEFMRQSIYDVTKMKVAPYKYRPSGKTDAEIVFELLEDAPYDETKIYSLMPALRDNYLQRLKKLFHGPKSSDLMPGLPYLLLELAKREEGLLSLMTGNFEKAARIKLGTQGLEDYFVFEAGAFGDKAKSRMELPAIAVEKTKRLTGNDFTGKNVVIIGDTLHDIRCGKPLGAKTIAAATGSYSREELEAEKPDFIFEDLSDISKVIDAIFS